MRTAILLIGGVAIAFICVAQVVAEPFQNLDFEAAVVDAGTPVGSHLPVSQALPCWSSNNYDPGYVIYDTLTIGAVGISIHDRLSGIRKPLVGSYSVFLQTGLGPSNQQTNAYISQVGDVPSNTRSLMFTTDFPSKYTDLLVVSLGGTAIPMQLYSVGDAVNPGSPLETFIGDVSAFAGQTNIELRFEQMLFPTNPYRDSGAYLDAITFSTIIAPEPSSLVLLAIGILSLAGYYWRCRNVQRSPSNIG